MSELTEFTEVSCFQYCMKGSEQDDGRVTTVYFILAKLEFILINFSYIRSHDYYAQQDKVQATKILVYKNSLASES